MKSKGFTLIELLVAAAIFSLIVGAASGLFVSAIRSQRKALASQELLDQTSYAMEYISRALRMAKKDKLGDCITAKYNYEITSAPDEEGIEFLNYNNECQEFYRRWFPFSGVHQLGKRKGGGLLTSNDLDVASFSIAGADSWDQEDNLQPRVTLFLDIQGKENSEIKIQTTISQRNLDVRY